MIFDYKFGGSSAVHNDHRQTTMSFAPDINRSPVSFRGKLNKKLAFREAISALHDVVVSDLRFQPKDKTAYKNWLAAQEKIWLSDFMAAQQIDTAKERIEQIRKELSGLYREKDKIMAPFYGARQKYFDYLYKHEKDKWFVLDPVITVHPDELFFEGFSQDESSYGKLSCNYNVFTEMNDYRYGTTNVDYSDALYGSFQKIRGYKDTSFTIDPSGFEVATTDETAYKELKIDVPDSWVRGFLQVSTAMTLPATVFELHPMDIFSLCQYLRRFKEKEGPRALRFMLEPGKPVRVVIEPWYEILTFHRSVYKGKEDRTIRIWGRRRLLILERLIPVATSFKVFLLGSGLPSFFIADLGDMSFTLGLSGWTANDWSRSGHFDLMAPRQPVASHLVEEVLHLLQQQWFGTAEALAGTLKMDTAPITAALVAATQAGKVIYDLENGVYRLRELSKEPLDVKSLRFTSEREQQAAQWVEQGNVAITVGVNNEKLVIEGTVRDDAATSFSIQAVVDKDHRLTDGHCTCSFYTTHQLKQGPCAHILAGRMQFFECQLRKHG